jgi:hypothetical protein
MRSPDLAPDRLEQLLRGAVPEGEDEARLQGLVRELRVDTPPAPDHLQERVRALRGPAPRRSRLRRPRLALVLVPALLVGLLSAAVLFGSGRTDSDESAEPHSNLLRAGPTATEENLRGRNVTEGYQANALGANRSTLADADSALRRASRGERAQEIDMSIELRLSDADGLSDAATEAMRVARELGGFVVSSNVGSRGAEGEAELALRIPVGNLEDAVFQLSRLGTITGQRVAMDDLQIGVDNRSRRIERLRRDIRIAELRLASGTLDEQERLRVEIRLERLRDSLAELRRERRRLLREAATAELSLTLHTRAAATAAEKEESGLEGAVGKGVDFLTAAGAVALFLAIVLSPLLLLGLLVWLALRGRSRRVEARLLAQPGPAAPSPQAGERR